MIFCYNYEMKNFIEEYRLIYNDELGQYITDTEYYKITINKWNRKILIYNKLNFICDEIFEMLSKYSFVKYER